MITGDGNLIELQGALRYRIDDARVWLFEVRDGPAILRSAAESVLRETVGSHPFSDLLTSGRRAFQEEVLQRLRQRCEGSDSQRLGIKLEGLSLHDLHPPQEVVAGYHEVTKAMEHRDRRVNQALTNALSQERQQQSQSLETIRQAEAGSHQTLALAQAQQDVFRARWQARNRLPLGRELLLLGNGIDLYLTGKPAEEAARAYWTARREALSVQAQLTDFRLYWDMLTTALSGRDKVIVDAENVPGRRHLWLLPPEMLRPPSILQRGTRDRGTGEREP